MRFDLVAPDAIGKSTAALLGFMSRPPTSQERAPLAGTAVPIAFPARGMDLPSPARHSGAFLRTWGHLA